MQHAILAKPSTFDFTAFLAGPFGHQTFGRMDRSLLRDTPTLVSLRPATAGTSSSPGWLAKLHISAARRWLARSPAQMDQVEASIREIAVSCAATQPALSRELTQSAGQLSSIGSVEVLLDRLERLLCTDEV